MIYFLSSYMRVQPTHGVYQPTGSPALDLSWDDLLPIDYLQLTGGSSLLVIIIISRNGSNYTAVPVRTTDHAVDTIHSVIRRYAGLPPRTPEFSLDSSRQDYVFSQFTTFLLHLFGSGVTLSTVQGKTRATAPPLPTIPPARPAPMARSAPVLPF
jgi:hypothetical protein